ncbi:uncharacterized protein LOC110727439 [Chenopodium quinoa]|uniref:uncharacterized protein LOC110727439 n=1 Tax=Chenopodium quinoa TaxID=63459 RepID=UPI000B77FEF9|nr:uncharacterized protein LOC110727439 [Chenopodium quinoa]
MEVRRDKIIDQESEVLCVEAEPSWMDPILAYKLQGELPEDRNLATKLKRIGSRFIVYNGELLKKSFSTPLLKYLGPTDADYILREIHFGICGNHIGGRTLAHKALRAGKWIEAEASSNITEQTVRKFIWQNIITRFGILKVFVFDHGRQFDNLPLRYTDQFGIKLAYSAVFHPQSNGQAKAANKQILNALKKRVEDQKSKWIEELPGTLWSLRTTEKEATGHSPFELVYGSETVLLVEIGSESL